jgi:hypothetical protein
MVMEIRETYNPSLDIPTNLMNIISLKNFLNILTIGIFVISLLYRLITSNKNNLTLLKLKDEYRDYYSISKYFAISYLLESVLFFLSSVKLTLFLKFSESVKFFYTSLEAGIKSFIQYSFFFLLIILGYAVVLHIIWGPYIDSFYNFSDVFIMTLLLSMGNYSI